MCVRVCVSLYIYIYIYIGPTINLKLTDEKKHLPYTSKGVLVV